ncbi:MAG: CPBP family intramembrane metalloprotease [Lachnospiraceae bacterium]|nr:CPBP family intramembrane metalloprotease [Lachnospiraceae bacterium]
MLYLSIFRGLLFEAIAKENVKRAIIISSVTFGIGHIINLLNGMNLTENLCQIIFALAVGFLFVTIYYRGGSLLPCIITHSAINSLNTFANEAGFTAEQQIAHIVSLIAVTVSYTVVLTKTLPEKATVMERNKRPKASEMPRSAHTPHSSRS